MQWKLNLAIEPSLGCAVLRSNVDCNHAFQCPGASPLTQESLLADSIWCLNTFGPWQPTDAGRVH